MSNYFTFPRGSVVAAPFSPFRTAPLSPRQQGSDQLCAYLTWMGPGGKLSAKRVASETMWINPQLTL